MKIHNFRKALIKNHVYFKEEKIENFPFIKVKNIPGLKIEYSKDRAWMREEIKIFDSFILKSCDRGKTGVWLSPIEELMNEINLWQKYKEKIPILRKVAIIDDGNIVCIVEPFMQEYNYEIWKKNGLLKRAEMTIKKLEIKYQLDCKLDNFVYN